MKNRLLQGLLATRYNQGLWSMILFALIWGIGMSCKPEEDIVLRQIKDVVVDATEGPKLQAQAVFYNPNKMRMKLRRITVDVFVDGEKVAAIDQHLKTVIPSQGEFTVPLEVSLAMEDIGLVDTLLGMLGGRKLNVQYKGALKLNYHGMPLRVPVDYKDEVRIRL
jgi:LEA14-like dessication related protein